MSHSLHVLKSMLHLANSLIIQRESMLDWIACKFVLCLLKPLQKFEHLNVHTAHSDLSLGYPATHVSYLPAL